MTIIRVSLHRDSGSSGASVAGFTDLPDSLIGSGTLVADLNDENGDPTGITLSEGSTLFTAGVASASFADSSPDADFPVEFFRAAWYGGTGEKFILSGFAAGQSYTLEIAGQNGNGRDTEFASINSTPSAVTYVVDGTVEATQPVVLEGTANESGEIAITANVLENFSYCNGFVLTYDAGTSPSISSINTDNTGNQYEQVTATVADFADNITTFTLGGSSGTVIDGDVADNEVSLRLPGDLATGTYTATLSNASESADIQFDYTQTHARPAFDGLVDSNSILNGQTYTENSYFRFVTNFSNGTLDTSAGDDREWQDDIEDYYTPDSGFTGDDTASIEFLYNDGTTSATVDVTITVEAEATEVPQGTITFGTPTVAQTSFSLPFSYDETDESGFEYRIDGGTWTSTASPIEPSGLTADTEYTVGARAVNSVGNGTEFTTTVTTAAEPNYTLEVDDLTTADTTPTITGRLNDAQNGVLTVTPGDDTYNLTVEAGTFSQALTELAIGTYTLTLAAEDQEGGALPSVEGTLSIADPPDVTQGRFRGRIVRLAKRSIKLRIAA